MVYKKWILILVGCLFFMTPNLYSQESGGTVAQAEENIKKKRKERAKAKTKADKAGKKRMMSIQSKETQKRLKKQQLRQISRIRINSSHHWLRI